jgi:uncharacterized membrane protein
VHAVEAAWQAGRVPRPHLPSARAPRSGARPALALAALLAGAGALHLLRPITFDGMVPQALPGAARTWTYVSGLAELGVAATVAHPRTRRVGGWLAAGLFVAVFPANVSMAVDSAGGSTTTQVLTWARLPLQVPLVVWGLVVARRG